MPGPTDITTFPSDDDLDQVDAEELKTIMEAPAPDDQFVPTEIVDNLLPTDNEVK